MFIYAKYKTCYKTLELQDITAMNKQCINDPFTYFSACTFILKERLS